MRRLDEKGVSPVIGVILMVAITVILAAVIASFVFGLGGSVKPVKTPGFSVTRIDSDTVQVTLTSKGGANEIKDCNVTGDVDDNDVASDPSDNGWDVGEVMTINNATAASHIIITCDVDGNKQVVLDTTV